MSRYLTIGNLAVFHWAMYWVMNALDKVFKSYGFGYFYLVW